MLGPPAPQTHPPLVCPGHGLKFSSNKLGEASTGWKGWQQKTLSAMHVIYIYILISSIHLAEPSNWHKWGIPLYDLTAQQAWMSHFGHRFHFADLRWVIYSLNMQIQINLYHTQQTLGAIPKPRHEILVSVAAYPHRGNSSRFIESDMV